MQGVLHALAQRTALHVDLLATWRVELGCTVYHCIRLASREVHELPNGMDFRQNRHRSFFPASAVLAGYAGRITLHCMTGVFSNCRPASCVVVLEIPSSHFMRQGNSPFHLLRHGLFHQLASLERKAGEPWRGFT